MKILINIVITLIWLSFTNIILNAVKIVEVSPDSLTMHVIEVDTLGNEIGDMEFNRDYQKELIEFYLDRNEFELALSVVDSALTQNIQNDTLYILQAVAYEGLHNWDQAANSYSVLYLQSESDSLKSLGKERFIVNVKKLNPVVSIEKITTILDSLDGSPQYPEFLMTIAEVYEASQLYEEANDIYKSILLDTVKDDIAVVDTTVFDITAVDTFVVDTTDILFKMVVNDIYLKNYEEVVFKMEPFLAEPYLAEPYLAEPYLADPSLNEASLEEASLEEVSLKEVSLADADSTRIPEALFFSYIAHYSLGNIKAARKHLLRLYLYYPEYGNRFSIIMGLAEIFEKEKQYIFSWYLLENYRLRANESEKYRINQHINRLRVYLSDEDILPNQFFLIQTIPEKLEELLK